MKKSYVKLYLIELLLFFIFILNSFVSSILNQYNMVIFLVVAIIIIKLMFGIERDRHRYTKHVMIEIIIYLLFYFILYYISGLFFSFARTGNYYTWYGLKNFIVPAALIVISKEILRNMILTKSEGNKMLIIVTCILFVFLDITNAIYYNRFETKYETFLFIALYLLPAISSNALCTYISIKNGYKPVILYLMILRLYPYLLPIVPNPSQYIVSVIDFAAPFLLWRRIYLFYQKEQDREVSRDYHQKRHIIPLITALILVGIMVYFTSGYFHYHAIAVASGSMNPNVKKGDVVVIEKIEGNYDLLQEGQVIAYRYDGVIIVHRLIKITKYKDHYYFYTKGDANSREDNWTVEEDMIIGIINYKVSYIGWPTVWLNEL